MQRQLKRMKAQLGASPESSPARLQALENSVKGLQMKVGRLEARIRQLEGVTD